MKKSIKSSTRRLPRFFRKWHRKLGVFAAFFIIYLSVTGVALNHTDGLSLAHQPIKSTWLLDHYGISAPQDIRFYQQGKIQITDKSVWLQGQLLFESDVDVISVGRLKLKHNQQSVFVIATGQNILLFNLEGELVDQLGAESGVPKRIKAMSIDDEQVIVENTDGYYQTDSDFFDWQIVQPTSMPKWLQPELASDVQIQQTELVYRAQFLTLERIILDSHSGRFFGDIGVFFMDFIAVLLMLISISGLYLWLRHSNNGRK